MNNQKGTLNMIQLTMVTSSMVASLLELKKMKYKVQILMSYNKELEKYNAWPEVNRDPLNCWKSRAHSMSLLAEIAKAILCVPGS